MQKNATPVSECNAELKLKGFKVSEMGTNSKAVLTYSRKDFHKICMNTGDNVIHYADKSFETKGTILFFANPYIPYSNQVVSPTFSGFFCLFSEEFFTVGNRTESLQQSPLFKLGGTPVFSLNAKQEQFITIIFKKMLAEQDTDYTYKDDLIRNYINLIIHEALKMQSSDNFSNHKNAATRIASVFLDLLERQFPIENTEHPLQLKSAQDFANNLAVHVNHLNRSVKEVTGKSTTAHIADRIVAEAKALLQHTNWSISEIAYALGFDYSNYFNNFFKKHTGTIPKAIRQPHIV